MGLSEYAEQNTFLGLLTLSGPGYLMSLKVRGGAHMPPLESRKVLIPFDDTLRDTLQKLYYRSAICFKTD